jgi:hypothetical protein
MSIARASVAALRWPIATSIRLSEMSPLLKIENLRIGFGNTEAVRGIAFSGNGRSLSL